MTTAEMYRTLVEKRPEMAVKEPGDCWLRYQPLFDGEPEEWAWWDRDGESFENVPEWIAAALIGDHWTERLPDGHFLCPCDGIHFETRVWYIDRFASTPSALPKFSPTRLEALFAYWMAAP